MSYFLAHLQIASNSPKGAKQEGYLQIAYPKKNLPQGVLFGAISCGAIDSLTLEKVTS